MSWENCLEILKTKLSPQSWQDSICGLRLVESNDYRAVVEVPSETNLPVLERSYKGMIELAFQEATGRLLDFEFRGVESQTERKAQPSFGSLPTVGLNEAFRFDTFVVGNNSQFASSASLAVAREPSDTKYNPLLIYGRSGLGKTHLLQAIGNYVQTEYPEKTVRYITSEEFTNEYVESLRTDKMAAFNAYYRTQVDVLLMDDVQFLSGRTGTQDEFFHIFNILHQGGKQIVLTSDNAPGKVVGLEERLISRFQWGLCVDVQPPDVETREAIIRKKAELDGLTLADDVISYLALNIEDNVRVIEGAIRKVLLQADIENRDISLDMVRSVVSSMEGTARRSPKPDDIISEVSDFYSIEVDKILESGRGTKEVAQARQVAMFIMKELTNLSLKSIGKRFGDRDHSTVVHANRTVKKAMDKDKLFKRGVEALRIKLMG